MQRVPNILPIVIAILFTSLSATPAICQITNENSRFLPENTTGMLHATRHLPSDLEVGGELANMPEGATRFIRREALLMLPQITFTVTDDTNFAGAAKISGVRLSEFVKLFAAAPKRDLVIAICDDRYLANYARNDMASHHPVLVLTVNGQPPSGWPKETQEHKFDMGPYMISYPSFTPSFKILSHSDEAQIPWGVVRLEFWNEEAFFGAIAPRGPHAAEVAVQEGFRIAQQNCFRCHNMGNQGGQKSRVPWNQLARLAQSSPEDFDAYIQNPAARNSKAQMPGNPHYDPETLAALTSYFKTLAPSRTVPGKKPIRENR